MCKSLIKIITKEKKGPKQNIKKHWETIYCNIILAKPILEKHIGVKNIKTDVSKRNPSCNIVNIIKGNNPKALKRPNKGRKYNDNIFKDRNNKIKKLALLGKCPSR